MSTLSCPGCGAAAGPSDAACAYCSRPLASLGCSACFARLFEGMLFCPACGSRAERPVAGAPEVLACPGCGDHACTSSLRRVELGKQHLHECLACHGLWLDHDTINTLERDRSTRALFAPDSMSGAVTETNKPQHLSEAVASAFRYRRCPVCAKLMQRQNIARISGVIVDRCVAHGTFFDVDELHAVVQFWENGGLDRARRRERESLEQERKRLEMLMRIDENRRRLEVSAAPEPPSLDVTKWLAAMLRPPRR